jgi:hypothetical protein
MALKPPHETIIRNSAELTELWRDMMGRGAFATRSVWHVFLEDGGHMNPVVVPIDDIPAEPDEQFLHNLGWIMREATLDSEIVALAVLLSRPGPAQMTAEDRRWARGLRSAFGSELCPWPIHLATRGRIQVFAPDDLIAA